MYRDDREALLAQCEALRAELRSAAGDAARQREILRELEAKLAQMEAAGITEAQREAAERGVRARGVVVGVGAGLVAAAAVALAVFRIAGAAEEVDSSGDPGQRWFEHIRPRCNPVEVHVAMQRSVAPDGAEGFAATCYALAHEVSEAGAVLDGIADPAARNLAASVMFRIIHPVADAGDDVAAGPVMELVVKHQPGNYMALFHAGIAAHETNRPRVARQYLERFLRLYKKNDHWTTRARQALEQLDEWNEDGTPPER